MKVKQWLNIFFWVGVVMGILIGCYSGFSEDKIEPVSINSQPETTLNPAVISPQLNRIDRPQLWGHIQALVGERSQESDREKVRNYLIQQLESFNLSPRLESFDQGINIIAERPGNNPEAGVILLAAHYDTVPNSPGADDNASGVAVVLEIARLLTQKNTPRSLKIVFFDQEEVGLLGSFAFTKNPDNLTDLQAAIILDMVGYACHRPGCQTYPPGIAVMPLLEAAGVEFPDRGEFLTVVGEVQHLPLLKVFQSIDQSLSPSINHSVSFPPLVTLPIPLKGLATPDVLRSDHAPFWYQDIPAVLITDTANLRSPHYHQPSDTMANLDPQFFEGSAEIIYHVVAELLNRQIPFNLSSFIH